MVASTINQSRRTNPNHPPIHARTNAAIDHAVRLIYRICCLAGSMSLIDEIRADLKADGVRAAIRNRDTAAVFDWLISALSYQGISDQVAYDYMERHGRATWHDIEHKLGQGAGCPKLKSYWHFHGCRYDKLSRTCAEPDHIGGCPLPSHDLRNGRLNQTAYSLFLFIRDIADGDLVGWIDQRLPRTARLARSASPNGGSPDRADAGDLRRLGQGPRHGPVQPPAGAPKRCGLWTEVGGSMIAIDTLVHNFLHRTGILAGSMRPLVWLGLLPARRLRRHH